MRSIRGRIVIGVVAGVLGMLSLSCSELNKSSAPVKLVVTTTQILNHVDLKGGANCDQSLGTVLIQSLVLQSDTTAAPVDIRFDDVKLTSYRVSYTRTDGGSLVPPSFVRVTSQLITTGGGQATLSNFVAFDANAFNEAPFAALLPVNGGRDPQTGLTTVKLVLTLEVFGETIAGEKVSGSTSLPLDFCYNCGGCA